MKQITRICWLLLGIVFIFSGLVKLNDPIGTALKLEEYFEVFSKDFGSFFQVFIPHARTLSIFLSSLEVVLGVAVLLRWMLRQTLWVLLALLVFFGFLTFYSAAFNKVTDCGCFGDFIKLTPWTSFAKDMFLLLLWAVVFFNLRYLRRVFAKGTLGVMYITIASAVAIGIGVRALGHLPYFDFLPYKEGNDIGQLMKPQEAARYEYVMERNGESKTFTEYPTDSTWKYKSMNVLNPEKSKPLITDFSVFDADGKDYTGEVLKGNKLVLVVQDVQSADRDRYKDINSLLEAASKSRKRIESLVITSSSPGAFDAYRHDVNLGAPFYFADATVLKSMIRSNPGLILLQNGVVKGKYHYHDIPAIGDLEAKL
ncbi:BT_3928 family protein [Hymenobacter mucosus]|uniref:Methylamine utilisation protein MauE domain-containing protein n=1 Tax=Hymenobacter mucosus TaxID=1411120 RepID=A0A238X2Y0_9BACT|nr:BT_3928 family protein [Hymenobacter mucosus]SNR52734.1 hypothetical protein SAMN06269173_103381 [Hymenobacter mucosus]